MLCYFECINTEKPAYVCGYAAYSQGGSLQNTTTIRQHKAVKFPATSSYIVLIGFQTFERLYQRPQSTYDVVGQGISDKATSNEMKLHKSIVPKSKVQSNGSSLLLNTPSRYKRRNASVTVDVGMRTLSSHRTCQEQFCSEWTWIVRNKSISNMTSHRSEPWKEKNALLHIKKGTEGLL